MVGDQESSQRRTYRLAALLLSGRGTRGVHSDGVEYDDATSIEQNCSRMARCYVMAKMKEEGSDVKEKSWTLAVNEPNKTSLKDPNLGTQSGFKR